MLALLRERGPAKSVCPSEVARRLAPRKEEWKPLMPAVRFAAASLAAKGAVRVTQRGLDVDPLLAKGPIRLRLPAS